MCRQSERDTCQMVGDETRQRWDARVALVTDVTVNWQLLPTLSQLQSDFFEIFWHGANNVTTQSFIPDFRPWNWLRECLTGATVVTADVSLCRHSNRVDTLAADTVTLVTPAKVMSDPQICNKLQLVLHRHCHLFCHQFVYTLR